METNFYENAKRIDNLIEGFSKDNLEKVISLFNQEPYLNYFFNKISKADNPKIFFDILFDKGFFNASKNLNPIKDELNLGFSRIPYWQALKYLDKIINNNIELNDKQINNSIISIINDLIEYKNEKDERIDNYHTDVFILKALSKLPIELIKVKHIEFFRIALNSRFGGDYFGSNISDTILSKLIQENSKELLEILLEIMFSYKEEKNGTYRSLKALMSNYWLGETLSKNHEDVIKVLKESSVIIPLTFITKIITNNKYLFSTLVVSTIEDNNQKYGLDKYEKIIISFLRDALISTEPALIYKTIEIMIKAKQSIFRRLAIYTINIKYQRLKNILWENFPATIDEYGIQHELYELIKNHAKDFDEAELSQLIKKIEMIQVKEPDKKKKIQYEAYRKKGWYKILLITGNEEIIKLYKKYSEIIPDEVEEPGRPFTIESSWGDGAPDDAYNIETMEVQEIVRYLNKHADDRYTDGLDRRFSMYVKKDLKKYMGNLEEFKKLVIPFKHSLIRGIYESGRNIEFDWEKVIIFIHDVIKQSDFWNKEKNENLGTYKTWLISTIADLLNDGMKRDEDAFDKEFLPNAKEILLILYNNFKLKEFQYRNMSDAILNSTSGRIYSALMNYSLRNARANNLEEGRWDNDIKSIFSDNLFKNHKDSLIFHGILGRYFINLLWLDKQWVDDNLTNTFSNKNIAHWKSTMETFLFYTPTLYKNIYDQFKENDFWVKALENLQDENSRTRLVGYILTGYLHNFEKLEEKNSLIDKLINMNDDFLNKEIIEHCSRMYGFEFVNKNNNDLSLKIQNLWLRIFNNINDETKKKNQRILSDLCKWLKLISSFNENIYKLCQISAKYASVNYNIPFLMEGFENHIETNPEEIGKLILIMIRSEYNSLYESEEEKFRQFVQILYKKKHKKIANDICNHFGMRGVHYLREYWDRNN